MHFLLTGGSGFIGQHLARGLMARGDLVTALVRPTSVRTGLTQAGVRFLEGDLFTCEGLPQALEGVDVVLHLAGVTKARTPEEYHRCNTDGTRLLVEAMARRDSPPRLVYCSSLAASGPTTVGRPRREGDPPAPVSTYGRSKLGGELAVRELAARVPSVIVRPSIVYGPADKEFLPNLLPMARLGVLLKSGFGPKHYSLVHVEDLCDGLVAAALRGRTLSAADPAEGVYHLSDGREYTWEEVGDTLVRALGGSKAWILPLPNAVSYVAGLGSELQARVRGLVPILNRDKAREMRCEAWTCSSERAQQEISFRPAFDLERGFQACIAWYRQEGLL